MVEIVYGIYYIFFAGKTIKAINIGVMDLSNSDKIKEKIDQCSDLKIWLCS